MARFGVFLPAFGYPTITMEYLKEAAQEAEALGYDTLQVADHPIYTEGLAAFGHKGLYDPIVTLSQLAAVTTKIHLGAGVLLVPLRHPYMLRPLPRKNPCYLRHDLLRLITQQGCSPG